MGLLPALGHNRDRKPCWTEARFLSPASPHSCYLKFVRAGRLPEPHGLPRLVVPLPEPNLSIEGDLCRDSCAWVSTCFLLDSEHVKANARITYLAALG